MITFLMRNCINHIICDNERRQMIASYSSLNETIVATGVLNKPKKALEKSAVSKIFDIVGLLAPEFLPEKATMEEALSLDRNVENSEAIESVIAEKATRSALRTMYYTFEDRIKRMENFKSNFNQRFLKQLMIYFMPPLLKDFYYYATFGIIENFIWMHPSVSLIIGDKEEKIYSLKALLGWYNINKYVRAGYNYETHKSASRKHMKQWFAEQDERNMKIYRLASNKVQLNMYCRENYGKTIKQLSSSQGVSEGVVYQKISDEMLSKGLKKVKKMGAKQSRMCMEMVWHDILTILNRKVSIDNAMRVDAIYSAYLIGENDSSISTYLLTHLRAIADKAHINASNISFNAVLAMSFIDASYSPIIEFTPKSPKTQNFSFNCTLNLLDKSMYIVIRGGWITANDSINGNIRHKHGDYLKRYHFNASYVLMIKAINTKDFGTDIYSKLFNYNKMKAKQNSKVKHHLKTESWKFR